MTRAPFVMGKSDKPLLAHGRGVRRHHRLALRQSADEGRPRGRLDARDRRERRRGFPDQPRGPTPSLAARNSAPRPPAVGAPGRGERPGPAKRRGEAHLPQADQQPALRKILGHSPSCRHPIKPTVQGNRSDSPSTPRRARSIRAQIVDWWAARAKNMETAYIGAGLHYVQEDQPYAIGRAIADWYRRIDR